MCMRYHCIVTIVLDTSVLHQPTDNHSLPMTHGLVEYEFYAQCISAYVLPYLRTHLRAWIDQCVQIFFMSRVSMMMMMIVRSVRTSTLVEGRAVQGKGHKKKGSTGRMRYSEKHGISRNKRK